MTRQIFFRLHKIFIYINLFNFVFGQTDVGTRLNHIPPNPPIVGETVSFEAIIPVDIGVMVGTFFYKMDNEQSYNEIEMEYLGLME